MKTCTVTLYSLSFSDLLSKTRSNIIFRIIDGSFLLNQKYNRIRRIARESECWIGMKKEKKELGFCPYIMATARQPTMTYFLLRFRLAENYVIPSLLYKLLLFRLDSIIRWWNREFDNLTEQDFFFFLFLFESKDETTTKPLCCRIEQGHHATMITTTTRRLLRWEFSVRPEGEERKSLRGGRGERRSRRGAWKGLLASAYTRVQRIQTRIHLRLRHFRATRASRHDRAPRPLFYACFVLILFLSTDQPDAWFASTPPLL